MLLGQTDEILFKQGACHIYAVELYRRWPETCLKRAGYGNSIGNSPKGVHVYASSAGTLIDVSGPQSESDYLRTKGYAAWEVTETDLLTIDPMEFSENGPVNRWMHYLDPD